MKQADIKRLERAVKYLRQAEENLDKAHDSIEDGPTEMLPNERLTQTTTALVIRMLNDVRAQRQWIEHRIIDLKKLVP